MSTLKVGDLLVRNPHMAWSPNVSMDEIFIVSDMIHDHTVHDNYIIVYLSDCTGYMCDYAMESTILEFYKKVD